MSKKRRKNKGEYKKGAKNLILEVAEEDEELKISEDEADENDGVPHAQDLSNEPTQTEDVKIAPEAAYSRLTRSDIYYILLLCTRLTLFVVVRPRPKPSRESLLEKLRQSKNPIKEGVFNLNSTSSSSCINSKSSGY